MRLKSIEQYHTLFLGLITFVICAFPKLTTLAIVLLAVGVVVLHVKKKISWSFNLASIALITLYLAYLVGIAFAEDTANGLKYAEYKMSLLIIPLLLSFKPNFELSLKGPVTGLIAGTIVASIIGIIHSCQCYLEHPWFLYCFSSSHISPVHHPSYFAAFLFIASLGAWKGYKEKWNGFNLTYVVIYILFALVMYFMCLTLAGMIFLALFISGIVIYTIYKKYGKLLTLGVVVITPILLYFLMINVPVVSNEFNTTKNSFIEYAENPTRFLENRAKEEQIPGNQVRLIMWTVTFELILEHPFGVGTGDVDHHLFKRLEEYGFDELVQKDLNPHNQYLQTTLEIGIVGLLILLFFIGYTLYLSIKYRSLLLFILIAGFAFNSLFESFLQRQSGIVFYAFWVPLVVVYLRQGRGD